MLLFLLRCSFWLAIVAMALPLFATEGSNTTSGAVAARAVAAKPPMIARASEAPRYFDDTTGSLESFSDCSRRSDSCAESAAKVDLIALQLDGGDRAPSKGMPNRVAKPSATGRLAAHHPPRRPSSIKDLLAR